MPDLTHLLGNWSDAPEHIVHLLVAFLLALPIALDREREDQSAGLRTFPLVAIASCGLVQTAVSVLGPGTITQASILRASSPASASLAPVPSCARAR